MTCAELIGQKHELQYREKYGNVKSGFQILYAVEQFSTLFQGNFRLCNRIELKQFFINYIR